MRGGDDCVDDDDDEYDDDEYMLGMHGGGGWEGFWEAKPPEDAMKFCRGLWKPYLVKKELTA